LTVEVRDETAAQLREWAAEFGESLGELLRRQLTATARAATTKWPGISMGPDGKPLKFDRMWMYGEPE
jgi:hypothetical protein